MSKLQDIRDLAQEHAVSVSGSPRDWMDYMDTASRLYRYSFSDQLLIHAQHPEATACASLELWNEKMFRWVNRGARGIALLDETGQHTRLRYVFDISDTHMVAGGRSPYLWKMQEHQREEILTHLAEVYALEEKDTATLQDALMAVAREMVSDNLEEYLDGLEYAVEGTYLEDLDEVTIRSDFRQLATDSVYYLLSRRCGLDPMELLEEEDFMHITDYNRLSVLTFLGNTASQLSESILIDIGKTVHKISLEEARKEVEISNERNYNNFTTLIREIKNQDAETKKEENIENEGGNDYGTDISSQGRLPVSESDRRRGRSDDREIWDAAEDISERTQEQPLSEPVPDREAEQPSGTDRESSTGENGQPDGEITGEESGTGQGSRSDGMDSTHERTDGNSGREHLDGIGIQLVEDTREDGLSKAEEEIASALSLPEYPTADEQRRQIEERAAALYAGEIPIPEEVVDEILRTGGNRKASQLRIIYNFMSEQTPEEYTEFVKREYRKGGKGFQIDGNEYSVWFDETGMQIAVGHTVTDHILDKAFLSWEDVSGRIHQLLDQGEYAPQSVLDAARSNAVKEHAQALAYMKGDMAEGVAEIVFDEEDLPHLHSIYPEITDYLEEKLEDPQWLSELNERLDALAEAYEENHSIMRFHHYNPVNISKQFQKFADEVIPYQARDGFAWKEHPMFITQDEIDAYLAGGGAYSQGRLRTYSFYLLHEDERSRTGFIKEQYGIGGSSHALSGADDSHANYDGKGLFLARGAYGNPYTSILLSWNKVANRVAYLIKNDQFLQAEDYARMPEYEREQMANKVLRFYDRLPEEIDRPFTDDFFWEKPGKEMVAVLENPEQTEELLQKMDAALAVLPLDFEAYGTNYQQKTELLLELHQYAEGTYTIFPTPEAEPSFVEPSGHQMTMFDFLDTKAVAEPTVVDMSDVEEIEEEEVTAEESISESQEQEIIETSEEQEQKEPEEEVTAKTAEELAESWDEGVFEYQGYHFEAVGVLPEGIEGKDLVAQTRSNTELHLSTYHTEDFPKYSYDDFYAVSNAPTADVFRCLETGRNYIPGENELFGYEGEFQPYLKPETENIVTEPHNFRIQDNDLGAGGPKAKYKANMEAIHLLQTLEKEERLATPEEQEILSRYVGWGGIPQAFEESNSSWANEYLELKNTLSPEEYSAARASTLNAFYTSPTVIRSMYEALENMGLKQGNILEPSCGVGNFMGMIPESMSKTNMYGVELDPVSGRIAKQLYQKNKIAVQGFEETSYPDSFFDCVIGNVPFGAYQVSDRRYDRHHFLIHDYFIAKSLDLVRPGGVVAFVTSRYTMDSKNSDARRYMAQRAELLGAIRLPNDAFKKNAGTEVVSDILFLQKRDHPIDIVPEWVNLDRTEEGHTMNSYFVAHPEMVLGDTVEESTAYGMDITVRPIEGMELSDLLKEAVSHIQGTYQAVELPKADKGKEIETIPATPDVKNFSYTVVDGNVYFRENSLMRRVDLNEKAKDRVMGMVELRGIVNELIEYQLEDYPDEMIAQKQAELNDAYDAFAAKNGLINNRANGQAFADDSSYYLLCSLENVDEDGNLKSKADMFTKRTIKPERRVTSVDTPSEALAISIGERGKVDLPFMAQLLGTPGEYDAIQAELRGVIFKDPMAPDAVEVGWQTADDYLSGDVRSKLRVAQMAADRDSSFRINVEALQKAQPKDLDASEIDVRLGATWIDADYIQQFMEETFETPYYLRRSIEVKFSELTAEWRINGKSSPNYNDVAAYVTYGTERANAYRILEETLNLKDIRIYDTIEDADGKQKRVLNKKETTLAQQKQQAIKDAFRDWIWRDPHRRETLSTKYNELFNSTRPREYDGSHIRFGGMNPDITLREHQRNAIAHVLYGGNTLLAHEVGAGKTFEMAASAMESKRLGLSQKSLFVVPNHLTLQWANEFLHLYPSAKLLVATKKDFETANRKKFCARIATGDYDAVIIGHSQFEKIPLSAERQERQLREQIDEIEGAIAELKWQRGENFTIKQMEKTRKSLEARLDKLLAADKKDDVITFEQLGVDRLFVDESHAFKNLFLYTKMRNVAGLSTSEAQKSSDMFMKCRYMDELTGGRGVIFATGTPVSNSMTELYTVMRYLQYSTLQQKNLTHFDSWASTFGETTTAIELAPEGTGYRARTRFAKFFNLPELMNMFKEVADIKTSDQLHLPVPEAKFETVVVQPSEYQKDMVASLSERAADVHAGIVDPSVDNMLKITSDGRKLGLDQRLMNPLLPDDPDSKLNACVGNILRIWQDGQADKLTQLVFCDLSTPKNDGTFNVYDDVKTKLIANGVPAEEVAFIHDADTEAKKKDLFAKVRTGQVRVLLGSTQKMGAGTNVQDKLVAVHHLDVGWRPSDMTQRNGRIIRQGNRNKEVQVYQYVTEGTFDAYLYQTLENKQKFISQIMTSKSPVRSCDDVDEQALSYAEIKALCAGNPLIKEKMDLDIDVARLKVLKADHQSQQYRMEDKLLKYFPAEIEKQTGYIHGFEADIKTVEAHPQIADGFCGMEIMGKAYTEKADAGEILLAACKDTKSADPVPLGSYRGFQMELSFDSFRNEFDVTLKGAVSHRVALGTDARGNITRLDNALAGIPERLERANEQLNNLYNQQEAAKAEVGKPFPQEAELTAKSQRLAELDAALNMEDSAENRDERSESERPSVLADLKSKAEHIPPAKYSETREEVL